MSPPYSLIRSSIRSAMISVATLVIFCTLATAEPAIQKPAGAWPHWPSYHKTPLDQMHPQPWLEKDHTIPGWDWSLPPHVKPAPNGLLAVYREFNIKRPLDKRIRPLGLPINQTIEFWVRWRDLEPTEGHYTFDPLQTRMKEAEERGCCVVLRILSSATLFAPDWLQAYNIPHHVHRGKNPDKVTNYDISHPEFHKRYLLLVKKLGESGIPRMPILRGAFVGYRSPAYGDEGIGPDGVNPDRVPHVIERLDAWAKAFQGNEHKVYMGGSSAYGYGKGFGTRRGFVEMFLYHIPDAEIGQTIDQQRYLYVDDSVELLKRRAFHGEENEEYEEAWATKERDFRFGPNTDSYSYRYFISNLRTLQMQCNHVLMNPFSLIPEQLVWVGQSLGRTVNDSPDIWCALRESYIRNGGAVKNMERWLYQRDAVGYETVAVEKIDHPIHMWMVPNKKNFDYIARQGKKIGLAVDDRWCNGSPVNIAIKTTYFDHGKGEVAIGINTKSGVVNKTITLTGSGKLMTSTFPVSAALFPAKNFDYDITYTASADPAVLAFVRIVRTD